MPKKHPDDTQPFSYRIKPPDVWAMIRARWCAGESYAALARQFDVAHSTIRARRLNEGWTRRPLLEQLVQPCAAPVTALTIAEAALARAVEALAQGRAADALALIKAGDAIGQFADFVARLRGGAGLPASAPANDDAEATVA
jgi:transposase-like protein